jgi:trans-2,3-dihydro-3-hydroxyanthranilate isomerase
MREYPFFQVDAFTTQRLGGNPCAIVFDADDLDTPTMLAIAREMNLSETAFVRRSSVADVGARYFTTSEEIPLAGHPTIATIFALTEAGRIKTSGERTTITLELPAGIIPVDIVRENATVKQIIMTQLAPQFLHIYQPAEVLPIFGLTPDDALPNVPIQVVSTGTPQLMLPLRNHAALQRARIQAAGYFELRTAGTFFSPHLFCLGGITPAGNTFARHIGTPPEYMEDPFTGSATGGMAAYLWHYNLLDTPSFVAEQGHWMQRPGTGYVEVLGPRTAISGVRVGGAAVTVLRGTLTID